MTAMSEVLQAGLDAALDLLATTVRAPEALAFITRSADMLSECFEAGNKVLACGNGGSACDAMHFAEEFTGRFRDHRKALPVIPLMESSHLTCVGNDYGFEAIFSRGVEAYGKAGDVLLAISTSGNSKNIIAAVAKARELGLKVILLLGKTGGVLAGQGDSEWIVRHSVTERIQEVHMLGLHLIIEGVERTLFPENYPETGK